MKIDELHIGGFGKWRDKSFVFAPGLNLFAAPNEAGKSTLLQALFAALYGLKRDYVRVTRYLEAYERYLPWDGGPYETTVSYTVGGRSYRLHRRLEKDREQARVYVEPEWEEITRQYREDRRKERNFLEAHLGLNRTLFTDVTWIRSAPLAAAQHLAPSLSEEEAGDPLIQRLLSGLEQDIAAIGKKESAESTLLGRASRQLAAAREALERAEEGWQSVRDLTRSVAEWETELARLGLELERRQLALGAQREREQEWQRWWLRTFETDAAAAVAEWERAAHSPEQRALHRAVRERLAALEQERDAIRAELQENGMREAAAAAGGDGIRYLSFADIGEEEWQSWLKGWYALAALDERQTFRELEDEAGFAPADLERLQADYRTGSQLVREMEQLRETRYRLLAELAARDRLIQGNAAGARETSEPSSGRVFSRRDSRRTAEGAGPDTPSRAFPALLAAGSLALATAVAAWTAGHGAWAAAALLAAVAAACWAVWRRTKTIRVRQEPVGSATSSDAATEPGGEREQLITRLSQCEAEVADRERRLHDLVAAWGAADWDAFLRRRERCLKAIHREELKRRETEERKRIRARLESQMLRWGVPPHLPFEEAAALVLREHAEWERRSREEQERLEWELASERRRAELADRLEEVDLERTRLISEWAERVRTLMQAEREAIAAGIAEAEERCRAVEERIQALREQIARAQGEIGQRDELSWARAKSAHEEALAQWEDVLLRRDALQLARDALVEAMKERQRELAPDVNQWASAIAARITGRRYADVRLHPAEGFAVRTIDPERREVREHQQLSAGTRDQLYFAQRLALLKVVSARKEPLPVFLDDHFIHYDDERLAQALDFLLEVAEEHQVFLFSCQQREQEMLAACLKGNDRHKLHQLA